MLPVYGGQPYGQQLSALRRGVHIVVGTPGRVIDHLDRSTLDLSELKTLVLDEADEMLRMGFIDDVEAVLKKTPETRQVALFSATMPPPIKRIAQTYLKEPVEVAIKAKTTTSANIRQRYWAVSGVHKLDAITRTERETWLFRNNFKYQLTPDWRLIGKLDHSLSDSSQGQFYDGGYTEAVIGYGYRPVAHDRFNALAKYTYFFNVPTTEQVTAQNTAAQFIQKSHIAALDLTYDLTDRVTLGGKYAYRIGEVSLDREDEWIGPYPGRA